MKPVRFLAVALLASAVLGLAACTQGGAGNLSGTAGEGPAEGAPAVETTVESSPVTQSAPPAASPAAGEAEAGDHLVPDGVVADDPKAAARAEASGQSDAVSSDNTEALGPGDSTAYVNAHNRWRVNYGSPVVMWDATLAALAQDWANQQAAADTFDHRQNNQYGENMWKGTSGFYGPDAVVDSWGSEVQYWDLSCTGDLEQCCRTDWWKCGHFTQLVWSTSTRIGCGKATTASRNDIVVCNYAPAGNVTGVAPFPPHMSVPTPTSIPTPAPRSTAVPTPTTAAGAPPEVKNIALSVPFDIAIPDNGAPVSGVLNVIHDGTIKEVYRVDVNITHPYVGDLSVKLVHPDGTEVMLHNQTGGSTQDLIQTYGRDGIPIAGLAKFVGKRMKGQWKLVVQDHAAEDSGKLNGAGLYRLYTSP